MLVACDNKDDDLRNNPIDSKISIETREVLGSESRSLTFYCRTEKSYPCINYPLAFSLNKANGKYELTFSGIIETKICLTAIGPATATVNLNNVPNGFYSFEVNNANLQNCGNLKVSDSEIVLNFSKQNGIEIVRAKTLRVPTNTFWGTIGYHTPDSEKLVADFLQKLKEEGALFSKQKPGHYFYYEIDNKGEIISNKENSGYHYVSAFVFQFNGNESDFKEKVKKIASSYFDDLYIYINSSKGETINNWTK
jgi:hypothetical protein